VIVSRRTMMHQPNQRARKSAASLVTALLVSLGLSLFTTPAAAGARRFYVTKSNFDGASATTACAHGFHMASVWEIQQPTLLAYDTKLGLTAADAGSGPPGDIPGWVHTGYYPNATDIAGEGNCNAWTSTSPSDYGSYVFLTHNWDLAAGPIAPWYAGIRSCDTAYPVWCIHN
jgi:hypothetical protein